MTANRIFFLSGLPRSGSTLLGSVLNQNPDVSVSPTSPLYSLLHNTNEQLNTLDLQYTFDKIGIGDKLYRSLVEAFYPEDRVYPIVFDKHRGWPRNVDAIRSYVDPDPKIVCTVRPVAEIIASYLTLAERDPENFIDRELRALGEPTTNEARANYLWRVTLKAPYENMLIGMRLHADSLLLVDYDQIVFEPQKTLEKVYAFCGMDSFNHEYDHIENTCAEEKDEAWGLKNLHDIRPVIKKKSVNPLCYLPRAAIDYFAQFDLEVQSWV